MVEENKKEFDFVQVIFNEDNCEYVKEVYRLHKDQARKIFDLASTIDSDDRIMDYVEYLIRDNIVFVAIDKDNGNIAGCAVLEDIFGIEDIIVRVNCHLVIGRKYWGKSSRDIVVGVFDYLDNHYKPIKRFEAKVPSHNFGIIKLLKDVGFKIEGTCKSSLVFNNKNGEPKFYNELIYSKINDGVVING